MPEALAGNAETAKALAGIFERISAAVVKQVQQNVLEGDDHMLDGDDGDERPAINLTAFLNDFGN